MTAISGTTSTGFEYSIPEGLQTDWNFVRAYQKMMRAETDMDRLDGASSLLECIFLDRAEEERFYKHLAELHGGRVPINDLFAAVREIVAAIGADNDTKN